MLNLIYSLNGSSFDFIDSFFHITVLSANLPGSSTANMVWRLLQVVLATIFVSLLAYYSLKMLGLARSRRGFGNSGNLSVLETIVVGQQSMVQLIKAGDKFLVIGVTKERVTLLSELDDTQVEMPEISGFGVSGTAFGNVLSRFLPPKGDANDDGGENSKDETNKE